MELLQGARQSRSTFSINEKPITNNFFFKKEGFYKTLSNVNLGVFVNQNGEITNRVALDEINKLIELQL